MLVDDLHRAAFRGSPLGRPVSIPASRIGKVSVDDIVKYRENFYTGDNTIVVAVGASIPFVSTLAASVRAEGEPIGSRASCEIRKILCWQPIQTNHLSINAQVWTTTPLLPPSVTRCLRFLA